VRVLLRCTPRWLRCLSGLRLQLLRYLSCRASGLRLPYLLLLLLLLRVPLLLLSGRASGLRSDGRIMVEPRC